MNTRLSDKLLNFKGTSPFGEAQAREFSDGKLLQEFYPTSTFWNRFNSQHEILVGSRGSGKTFLLRMLSYSCLRRLQDPKVQDIVKNRAFFGFYIPLHLEFMAAIEGDDGLYARRVGYFTFAFNCAAVMAFLSELRSIIADLFPVEVDRLPVEYQIAKALAALWFTEDHDNLVSVDDLKSRVNRLFYQQPRWLDDDKATLPRFTEECLRPIYFALLEVNKILGINSDQTSWLACIDEAEFVKEPFLKCINSALRSAKRPLVVKLATLPFKHSTRDTTIHGVSIEPRGNDFNYRLIDLVHDSEDFIGLSNYLCQRRLARCLPEPVESLEAFLGMVGHDALIDYYRSEMDDDEGQEDVIYRHILKELSRPRQRTAAAEQRGRDTMMKPIYNRFYPVYFCRRLKREEKKGNRVVGWFAGAKVCRMVADGNPRRFIQLMNDLFEEARAFQLIPKRQHRIITAFCERALQDAQGLPALGHITKELIKVVCGRLSGRVHGDPMVDGGCGFIVDQRFLESVYLAEALKLAIAYSHIIYPEAANGEIGDSAEMRVSYVHAVNFWLPMRKGEQLRLRPTEDLKRLNLSKELSEAPITTRKSREFVQKLQLQLFDET
jgi:hypothetical protein